MSVDQNHGRCCVICCKGRWCTLADVIATCGRWQTTEVGVITLYCARWQMLWSLCYVWQMVSQLSCLLQLLLILMADVISKVAYGIATKFYGLPKVHKERMPIRPIVSSIRSVAYETAKELTRILKPMVGRSPYHVQITRDFI